MRYPICFFALIALACSSSHVDEPPADAGVGAVDVGPDVRADAGPGGLSSCELTLGEPMGEGCFCSGPAVRFGDFVYRQAIGIEVWDVSAPLEPVLAGQVDERPASSGGLAVVDGHLVSVRNIEAALAVYALDDPRAPALVASLPLDEGFAAGLVADGRFAVAWTEGAEAAIVGVDLSSVEAPREAYREVIEGRIANAIVDGDHLYVATRETAPARGWLEVRDLRTGALEARHLVVDDDAAPFFAGLAAHRGRLVRTAVHAVEILDLTGDEPVVVGRLETPETQPVSLAVDGDLLLVGGGQLVVADLTDPSAPRVLGRGPAATGDVRTLLASEGTAFVSNGNALLPISLACE